MMEKKKAKKCGLEKGEKKKQIEIAKNLLKEKADIELIIRVTRSYQRRNRKFIIKLKIFKTYIG